MTGTTYFTIVDYLFIILYRRISGTSTPPRTPFDLTRTLPKPTARQAQTALPSLRPPTPPNASPRQETATTKVAPAHDKADSSVQTGVEMAPDSHSVGLQLTGTSWVSVYDRLNSAIKVRHYSPKTWQVYRFWTRQFQTFNRSKDPQLLSMEEVKGFLSFLAVDKNVSAAIPGLFGKIYNGCSRPIIEHY